MRLCLAVAAALIAHVRSDCIREPIAQTDAPLTEGTNGFRLEVRGNPRNDSLPIPSGYIPGEYYTVVLRGFKTAYTVQTFRGFSIVAVGKDKESGLYDRPVGKFRLNMRGEQGGPVERSTQCWHAVAQTSLHPKAEVEVVWQAPPENVGCVQFRAMVLEYRDIWYMDAGNLTKTFCQLIGHESVMPDDSAQDCCACDEAKYEIEFTGLWSRNTHPKDFPTLVHLTHFSDIIGASHSPKFHLWSMGSYATDGLRELAEWGNTYSMEQELKTKAKEIRTIVKARGLWYPNVLGTAKAMFRVDKYHHLASLASMFGPSPDWCVGVDSVNLCLPDCSWVQERSFDLFPWDAGTDSGATYMSPNNPTLPRQPIAPITTKDPADPKAPFYDPYKAHMPPLARLTLRREKVYPMECKNASEYQRKAAEELSTSEQLEFADRRECGVESWSPWSLCSATCGKGIRMRSRVYRIPIKAQMFNCQRQMTEKQFCNAPISVCEEGECGVESWSPWSLCSATCGKGIRMRSRVYRIPIKAQMFNCQRQMTEKQFCNAPISVCEEGEGFAAESQDCRTSLWSAWTQCSVTCAMGTRSRTKNYEDLPSALAAACDEELVEQEECEGAGGLDCSVTPDPRCRLTFWSDYSPCSASCGRGVRVRTRMFYYPENSDVCSERKLMEREECNDGPCQTFFVQRAREICAEPLEKGQCNGVFPRSPFTFLICAREKLEALLRYYYSPLELRCLRFSFSGCKGNRNNFETLHQCRKACDDRYEDTDIAKPPVLMDADEKELETELQKLRYDLPSTTRRPSTTSRPYRRTHPRPATRRPSYERTTRAPIRNPWGRHRHSAGRNSSQWSRSQLPSTSQETELQPEGEAKVKSSQIPSWKVLQAIAGKLNVHSVDHFLNMANGMLCVPANQLAAALGVSEVNDGGAPIDCKVSYWSPWSECSRSCGRGRRQRTRAIEVFQRNSGQACPPNMVQRMRCVMRPCPAMRRCELTLWSEWSACTASCGRGFTIRRRRPQGGPRRAGTCGGKQRLQRRSCEGPYCDDGFL